jgi:3-methyladenine DNA glycosylase AlkD
MKSNRAQLAAELIAELHGAAGATAPSARKVRKRYSGKLDHASPSTVRRIARILLASDVSCARFVTYELIRNHKATFQSLSRREIESLGHGMASWSDVDCFSIFLAGPAWREGLLPAAAVRSWALSPDRWWRRAALVATVPLNVKSQGGAGDAGRTLAICRLTVTDRDPMVVKALSWALRALTVREPREVARFLRKHNNLPALVVREVTSKRTTGRKNSPPKRRL